MSIDTTTSGTGTTGTRPADLRARGALLRPGDAGYDRARAAWNRNAQHTPAAVVVAESAADVRAAVRLARAEGLGVGVLATGHGNGVLCDDGGLLVTTSRMRGVRIDPGTRTARVEAGARWTDVVPAAAEHGLAGLPGSSSGVGVVGYTLGGGLGWLGRRYGLAAGSVTRAELVTADGDLVRTGPDEDPDLFWGVPGSGGNLGIVTALEFALHPVRRVRAGNLFYPLHRAREVLAAYADWTATLPDEMATAVAFRTFPPLPTVPAPMRGRMLVAVRVCWCGDDLDEGERWIAPLRAALGTSGTDRAEIDTVAEMPITAMDTISSDPVDPLGASSHSDMLRDLSPAVIDALVELGPDSPLIMLELRQLGGALSRRSSGLSPMAHGDAAFTLNAIGITPTPERTRVVRSSLRHLAEVVRPHVTGTTYLNYLDLEGATPDRVAAAYSPADRARLLELKTRLDPDTVFRFTRNVLPPAR